MLKKLSAFPIFRRFSALEIYTDGGSKGPVGSWAFVITRKGKKILEKSGRVRKASCNEMEFQAAIEALSSVTEASKIILYSDSRILIDAMKSGHGPQAYQNQMQSLKNFDNKFKIEWLWIKAHHGNEMNERCDELCVLARS